LDDHQWHIGGITIVRGVQPDSNRMKCSGDGARRRGGQAGHGMLRVTRTRSEPRNGLVRR
jgi:hypothetical protein